MIDLTAIREAADEDVTVIYTDQMNVTVPRGYLVKRSVDA